MQNNQPSINLVKNQQTSLLDKFINWTLTIGRLIVIITEVVAVIAFIYRFSLDEKLIDLHSSIKKKENIVLSLKNKENKYRNLQDRIALASTFSTNATNFNQITTDIISLIPNQATINNFILDKDRINVSLDIASVSSLGDLINSLKSYRGIKSISVDNIENKPSSISVNITMMLK